MKTGITLEARMKQYENILAELPENIPIILRIDGRAFHTFCRGLERPYDETFIKMMNEVGLFLCEHIQNCQMAYLQSDEISFLVHKKPESSPWFKNDIQKMTSISASLAASFFTMVCSARDFKKNHVVSFDSRVFLLPEYEVVNYFIWRQRDWERNSVQMMARSLYSQTQLQGKKNADMQEMIFQKGQNWNDLAPYLKRGRCIVKVPMTIETEHGDVERNKWIVDNDIPIFSKSKRYVEDLLTFNQVTSDKEE